MEMQWVPSPREYRVVEEALPALIIMGMTGDAIAVKK